MTNKDKNMIFLDALTDALGDSEGQTSEEMKEDLRSEGINVEDSINRLMGSVKDISMAAKRQQLEDARENRLRMSDDRSTILDKFAAWPKEQLIERIKEIFDMLGGEVSFAYRELESQSIEDMKSLLEDLELARIRHEREKDGNGE